MKRLAALILCLLIAAAVLSLLGREQKAQADVALAVSNHLVVIPMENKSYSQIVGNTAAAPYINNTLIPGGRAFTNYYAVTHPSLPDYLVLTAGDYRGCVTDACVPNSIPGENIFHELNGNWKIYAENMPSNCYRANKAPYLVRHNPAVYFTNLDATGGDGTCQTKDVPYSQLATDITNNALPGLAWIIPNQYNDMHNEKVNAPVCNLGSALQNQICQGDTWLTQKLPDILSNGGRNDVTVLLVFDEAASGQNAGGGGKVLVVEYGAGVAPGTVSTPFNHYGLVNAMADSRGVAQLHPAVPSL